MNRIKEDLNDFKNIDHESRGEGLLKGINPFIKLFLTLIFLIIVVSRKKYDLIGVILSGILPLCIFILGELSIGTAIRRLRIALPFILLMGVMEPFFNTEMIAVGDGAFIRGGIISGTVLVLKAFLAVLWGYILISTTTIEEICYALRKIHVPKIIVIVILLVYRYMGILMSEARRVALAYELRAPGQKGISFRVWGSLIGQMLLRSMDRAENLYQSMKLRGFNGDFYIE